MRGLVMGVNLLQNALSAALGQALLPLADDPLLVWNYGIVAILAFLGALLPFSITLHRDRQLLTCSLSRWSRLLVHLEKSRCTRRRTQLDRTYAVHGKEGIGSKRR